MPEAAVCDAHALIWAATGNARRLGRGARRFLAAVEAGDKTLHVPAIALVEIGEVAHRGRVRFSRSGFAEWAAGLGASGNYRIAPLTVAVIIAGETLHGIPERGDRLVAATAIALGLPLITRDPAIAAAAAVPLIW